MKLSQFDYLLPKKLIAQKPAKPRDSSRLLVLDRKTGKIQHKKFFEIDQFLEKGDLLVFNDTKVIPARLFGKKETGGKIEILLVRQLKERVWEALLRGKNLKKVKKILLPAGMTAQILAQKDQLFKIKFPFAEKEFSQFLEKYGAVPTPPYIKTKAPKQKLVKWYQTVFAQKEGAVAGPTAGFHFTNRLINKLKKKGIKIAFLTLHISWGTFAPIKTKEIEKHKMHPEWYQIPQRVFQKIKKTKTEGKRVIAVGTTVCRALESAFSCKPPKLSGWTRLYIKPGYKFKVVDAVITNFHLPKTSLLVLVSAFAGCKKILTAYREAIKRKYRFYSFGDAMLIK